MILRRILLLTVLLLSGLTAMAQEPPADDIFHMATILLDTNLIKVSADCNTRVYDNLFRRV